MLTKAQKAERQENVDAFYHAHGPCCAGCDWWRYMNSFVGECKRSAPVAGAERFAMLGIAGASMAIGAGHVMTPRTHVCGQFKDAFDWRSLPPGYLRRIGYPVARAALKDPGHD